jgi:hypothetical protein
MPSSPFRRGAAIARDVFGNPMMEVGDELFWGFDDFAHLERCRAGTDPLDATAWRRWSAGLQPSAVRRTPAKGPGV